MKAFAVLATLVALASANLQPLEDPMAWRRVFGYPPEGRIVGGAEAEPNSIPYQVAVKLRTSDGKQAFCGGSLVSESHVLTAAHCCEVAVSAEVILGAHNIHDDNEPNRKSLEVPKENIVIHEGWSKFTLLNDICVLNLPQKVEFTDAIQPIKIADSNSGNFEGAMARASGWGKDSDSATSVSPVLRHVVTDVISNTKCNVRYFGMIKKTHICSNGAGGKSTCNGDSGGPLAVEVDNEWTLAGITSFGISFGCEIGWPAAFTRVSEYSDWIKEKTGL